MPEYSGNDINFCSFLVLMEITLRSDFAATLFVVSKVESTFEVFGFSAGLVGLGFLTLIGVAVGSSPIFLFEPEHL